MSESDHKIVFVELQEIGAAAPIMNLQLKFSVSDCFISDSKKIVEAIKLKKPRMNELLSRGKVVIEIESDAFPGKFVEVGDDSPIKDRSCLKCSVTRPPQFDLEKPQREELPSSFVCVKPTPTDTLIDGDQEQVNTFTSETSCNEVELEQNDSFINEISCNGELIYLAELHTLEEPNSILVGVGQKKDIMETVQQSTKGKQTVGKKSLAAIASCIPKKEFVYASYKLPSYYGQNLDMKMKNGVPLNFLDYSSLARELGKSIQQHCTASDPKIIRYVVCKVVSEYPDVLGKEEESKPDFQHLICQKISAYLGRKRREIGLQKSTKGGRPSQAKNVKVNADGRARRTTVVDEAFDQVSYEENVNKMLELFSSSNGIVTQAIITLWKITFSGRRKQFSESVLSTVVQDVVKSVCPLLQFQPFLNEEFEGILGGGIVKKITDNWKKFVPKIISVALTSKSKPVVSILSFYSDLSVFEEMSCASLELLPLLILQGKRKKNANLYFIDCRVDSVDMSSAIEEIDRPCPFLMKCGNYFHVVAGKSPFLYVAGSTEALISLLAVYYVFDLEWCKDVLAVFLFIESELLERTTDQSKSSNAVNIFKNLLHSS